jgi:hypothetical protein
LPLVNTALAARIREQGIDVFGSGEHKTPLRTPAQKNYSTSF